MKTKPRDLYDFPDNNIREEPCQENEDLGFILNRSTLEKDNDLISISDLI